MAQTGVLSRCGCASVEDLWRHGFRQGLSGSTEETSPPGPVAVARTWRSPGKGLVDKSACLAETIGAQ